MGVQAALAAAVLFGAGTPLAKLLLTNVNPWLLAGLLYTGSGVGLGLYRLVVRAPRVTLAPASRLPLAGAVLFGGILGPVLLMIGLVGLPASGASLLLNAEGVFTAVLAWVVFKENVDRRVLLGMVAIVAGAVVLSVPAGVELGSPWPSLAVVGACLCWGIDNNLTRKVALTDASWLAAVKGGVAGPTNLVLAALAGATWPPIPLVGAAMVVGLFAYGVSLVLFVVALRHLGTARAGAYFSVAPFFGAARGVALGDPDAVAFGDYHVARNIGWALIGEEIGDDQLAELLEPYRGHRYRVQRLLELAGIGHPRRGARMSPRTHLPTN